MRPWRVAASWLGLAFALAGGCALVGVNGDGYHVTGGAGGGGAAVASGGGGSGVAGGGGSTVSSGGGGSGGAPACGGSNHCVASPGAPWSAPIALDSSCPMGWMDVYGVVTELAGDPPSAACGGCLCAAANCAGAVLVAYADGNCASPLNSTAANGTCVGTGGPASSSKIVLSSCAPSGGGLIDPSPATSSVLICSAPLVADSCGPGEVCVPIVAQSIPLCVTQAGDPSTVTCPPNTFKHTVGRPGFDDTRQCKGCTCSAPNCTYADPELWDGMSCDGNPTGSIAAVNSCMAISAASASMKLTPAGGTVPMRRRGR